MKKLLMICLMCLGGCSSNTGGALISLPFRVAGLDRATQGPLHFIASSGWNITLNDAHISLGPFYFNAFPPATFEYRSGVVLVQATTQVEVNTLDPSIQDVPGGADGETGHAVAAEVDLFPPNSTSGSTGYQNGGTLGGVSGTAISSDGLTIISFSGPITIDASLSNQTELASFQRVTGAAVDLPFAKSGQVLQLNIDPRLWLDTVDFASLKQVNSRPRTWTTSDTFMNTLVQSVRSTQGVYQFQLLNAR